MAALASTRKVDDNQYLERIGADMQRGEWADPQLQKSIVATWAESWYTTTAPLKPSTRQHAQDVPVWKTSVSCLTAGVR